MKVLFAVSSESISEAIIKKYQKEYKEILSYKNVYYFNAILKEIQKDKTYDRIVISEDLEPFSNNNYDTIDKFIFEKLDSISDEALDSHGKDTSIILICTDRRVKGSSILVKLFGIGVYNALLGNDRSMDEVCKLINRPRSKKEAKIYYRIDAEDVNYKAESENEVSEVEIQNILAHFKKLGRNTAKYSESFNNIAAQYTDEQLRIIVNCLPINVKAILESECERYQELMAVTGKISSVKSMMGSTNIEGVARNEINQRTIGQAGNINGPIVIPSAVRNAKNPVNPVVKSQPAVAARPAPKVQPPVQEEPEVMEEDIIDEDMLPGLEDVEEIETPISKSNVAQASEPVVDEVEDLELDMLPGLDEEVTENDEPEDMLPGFEEIEEADENADLLPGLEEDVEDDSTDMLPGIEEDIEEDIDDEPRRGRGRPRKTPVGGMELKPKGKRGRPRKFAEGEEEIEDEVVLPGLGDFDEVESTDSEVNDLLPGLDEEIETVQEDLLPGVAEETEEYEEVDESADLLPGLEDDLTEEVSLPDLEGLEDDTEDLLPGLDEEVETAEEDLLPGVAEETEEYEEVDENSLVNDTVEEYEEIGEEDYTEEVSLPGLDDLDSDLNNVDTLNDNVEEYEEVEDDGLLPGIGNEEYEEEETLLPGMGFEDEDDTEIPQRPVQNSMDNNSLESIRPKVDYSMSSLNSLITKDKKIVTFIGTSKNGTSFLVNNLAALFSSLGINTAILDMTKNKNSYYIFTKNEEELRNVAYNSIEKLQNGYAEGVKVDKNLTVYTDLPASGKDYSNAEPILSTLIQNHSLILIDCDYDTDASYFASCQEMYLVQSMDILTIQPLTAFLRELKTKGVLEPEKIRVIINKEMKIHKKVGDRDIIGGLAYYNDPAMSFMTELFNKDTVKAISIPFDPSSYARYLGGIVDCEVSLNGYSKQFLSKLKLLGDMVYPLTSKQSYSNKAGTDYNPNAFSNSMNDTLSKMRKKY